MTLRLWSLVAALSAAACAAAPAPGARPARSAGSGPPRAAPAAPADGSARKAAQPIMPPVQAFLAGLMPLASSGVPAFLAANPSYDGRGVIIAILDSGIDPAAPGLVATSTGAPKLIDLRDFSGEGRVALVPATLDADGGLVLAGRTYEGAGRIHRIATGDVWYGGAVRELALGRAPASDINGNGSNTDVFPVVVVKAAEGWAAFLDTNLNGSFEDETPLHDYRHARETLALGTRPVTLAATFSESAGRPVLDLYFDTYGHGTHVAGIAAGHNLYDIVGFDGVAPGAQVIGLKIANNARGSITTHGSLARALAYAAQFAERRGMPLVLNLSFGIGNEREGRAAIDSIVNAFLTAHPAVVLAISAGNDGPGLSTLGFPASADLALTVGATFPGPFTKPLAPGERPPPDGLGWWSGRGGDLAKPDLVAPGIAYSTVPRWETGQEVKLGTSMAAPHVAGLAACLLSAMIQERRPVSGVDVGRALVASARPLPGGSLIDQGAGNPVLQGAYDWLVAGHQGSGYVVRAASGASAALRRDGLSGPGDTTEIFRVAHAAGRRAARYLLRSDVPWLVVPEALAARPGMTDIAVRYRADAFMTPGLYVGTVTALNPNDSLAGPLFRLINTVVVPIDLRGRSLQDAGRRVAPGRAQRYFLRVPTPQATLHVMVTVPDSARESAIVKLYEPSGRPVRGVGEVLVGDEEGGTAEIVVPAQELVPGVYELNVIAPPLSPVTVDVQADMSPVALAFTGGAVEISNPGASSVSAPLRVALVGAERTFDVAGRGAPAESLLVRVPDWAARAEIDFEMPVERWQDFTDFALTVFDSAGQVMEGTPLDYAVSRLAFTLDGARRGRPVTIELFPAYAWSDRTPPWRARVTVRFLAVAPDPTGGPREITVTAGGRLRAPLPVGRAPAAPEGFVPVVEATVGTAVRRGTSEGGGR